MFNVFILNIYSSPSDKKRDFKTLLITTVRTVRNTPFVVAGDFNAPNPEWGSGSSVSRDTTPDLTFFREVEGAWDNVQEGLGSDHCIIESRLRVKPRPLVRYEYVVWDLFRKIRDETASSEKLDASRSVT